MANDKETPLFDSCTFAIVISRDLPIALAEQVKKTLKDNGGEVLDLNKKSDVQYATHIISETSDFPQYADSRLYMIPTLKPAWITQSLLRNKEAQMRPYNPDPNNIFSGVTISCADIPTGDQDAIIGAVLAMGGMETSNLTKITSHICALSYDHPKCQSALEKGLKCKIVLPHWFDDCLKLGKRIDEGPYLLPDPDIFKLKPEDDLPIASSEEIRGASSLRPESLPNDSPVRPLTIFGNKNVMISKDLELSNRTRQVIEDLIVKGGGRITTSVHEADIFVCHWRSGRDYVFASRAGIDVGNLSWLYHLIANNEWTSPLRRLLHYPVPRDGILGFKDLRITLSNYGGEARTYLESLVTAAGADFTKSMKQDNTHLITARNGSEKCDAAKEWNIEMINHLWIEESYAKCQIQKLTDPRYTHFPPRTNLGEIIGQTQFDAAILEEHYFPRDPTPSPGDPQPLRRRVMHEKDRNASTSKGNDDDVFMEDEREEEAPAKPAKKVPVSRVKSKTSGAPSTPAANRRTSNDKENGTPVSTGSRSAKSKAVSRLHDIADDINLYEKEKKRKGSVFGGERAANNYEKQKTAERSSSPVKPAEEATEFSADEVDEVDEEVPRSKKRQRTGATPVNIRLLITGYQDWVDAPAKEEVEKKKLRDLGILVIQDPLTCSHLAAPHMVRTKKFLCALAAAPSIVSTEFIGACIKKGKLPETDNFFLKDVENEKKFGLKLRDVVARAKANKRGLLRRVPVYSTKDIENGSDTFRQIVEANGGMFGEYLGRPTIKKTKPEEDDGPAEPVYLLTGQSPKERNLWPKFEQMAREGNMIPRIVHAEWLLDVAMSQQHKWSEKYLATKD